MVYYKTSDEVELIRQSCLLVCKALEYVAKTIKPGLKAEVIDKQAEELIRDHGAEPGFKGYKGFPSTLCVSVNESVVHGIPGEQEFVDGDIVSVDCGVFQNGFFGDAAYTFAVGDVDEDVLQLMRVTRESLYLGIGSAVVGKRLGDIGNAIQDHAERKHSYGVVRELVGHGIGKSLHESPEVPNYGRRGTGPLLKDGLVIAIEPMINLGLKEISQLDDGWTVITRDKKASAHFEHTVVVRKGKADILSDHNLVEKAIRNNTELKDISEKN